MTNSDSGQNSAASSETDHQHGEQEQHQGQVEQEQSDGQFLEEALNYDHQCYICDKIFSANSNLNRHLRKIHQENVQSPYNNVKCALCDAQLASSSLYIAHLEKEHDKKIETEYLTFARKEDFDNWKHSIEIVTTSQFIKSRGQKQTQSVHKTYFSCNRSGYFVSKAKTQKKIKKQGSRKINGRCPASMNVKVNLDSSYEVKFIKTHVGHDFDLIHLDLSEKDRELIVEKLNSGVTKRDIIRQLRLASELDQNTLTTEIPATSCAAVSPNSTPISRALSADIKPIAINSRSSAPGCSEQHIEVVIPATSETPPQNKVLRTYGPKDHPPYRQANEVTRQAPATSLSSISRLHLATTKDILNILNSKHLDSRKIRHNYHLNAVDAWIQEMHGFGEVDSTVLFYKDQNKLSERFPKLRQEDFMLVLMKDGQADMLKKRASSCIVIDSTHYVLCEYLQLAYMSVIDGENKHFPVAFMFSTRTDLDTLEVFYSLIKQKAGKISTRTLIADDFHDFYQAWWKVMSMPLHNLLTPWSVFDSWSKKFDLIKNRDKLRKLKKQLRAMLTETETDKFDRSLASLADFRNDPDTCNFMEYFDEQFSKNPDVWSSCFRKSFGVTNHQLWSAHEKFKTVYKEGKNSKKLCKYITSLMDLFEEEQLDKLSRVEEANRKMKSRAMMNRHQKGVASDSSIYEVAVEPAYWLCPSDCCSTDVYDEIRPISNQKEVISGQGTDKCCDLVCTDCKKCRHVYTCTCLDYVVNLNMCKHIHRVCNLCQQS